MEAKVEAGAQNKVRGRDTWKKFQMKSFQGMAGQSKNVCLDKESESRHTQEK